jgi:hypothetical protein
MSDQLELLKRLCVIADKMVESRLMQMSDDTIRILRAEVETQRGRLLDGPNLIGYECTCVIECLAELAYSRTERHKSREDRAIMYINCFRVFLRGNHDIAARAAAQAEAQ